MNVLWAATATTVRRVRTPAVSRSIPDARRPVRARTAIAPYDHTRAATMAGQTPKAANSEVNTTAGTTHATSRVSPTLRRTVESASGAIREGDPPGEGPRAGSAGLTPAGPEQSAPAA